jgi:hypothetical protein
MVPPHSFLFLSVYAAKSPVVAPPVVAPPVVAPAARRPPTASRCSTPGRRSRRGNPGSRRSPCRR